MKIITFLLALFSCSAIASATAPRLNGHALSCGEFNFRYVTPRTPETIESIYCGYLVNDPYVPSNTTIDGKYVDFASGIYSTNENAEGHAKWLVDKTIKNCEEGQAKALEILKRDYPTYTINCSRYFNFDILKR